MTVASLWPVLLGCGTSVGTEHFLPRKPTHKQPGAPYHVPTTAATNLPPPSSTDPPPPRSLAIDLSIWVVEALSSTALVTFHADPAAYLIHRRTVALLKMGIRPVFCIEGNRRTRRAGDGGLLNEQPTLRTGTPFWNACRSASTVLYHLGVPVLQASHEGEGLCAILNREGLVDGVLSNDADCLLFGAKVLYTNFSIQALESCNVTRYDISSLWAETDATTDDDSLVSDSDEDKDGAEHKEARASARTDPEQLALDRNDLIAFALLTGSDLVGEGVPQVGAKKALRFIQACRRSHPLHKEGFLGRSALENIRGWDAAARSRQRAIAETSAAASDGQVGKKKEAKERCCALCLHPGDKRSHERNGCEECGTGPGESCYKVSSYERFKLRIREKALYRTPTFASQYIIDGYNTPNDNIVPKTTKNVSLDGISSFSHLPRDKPRYLDAMQCSGTLIQGHSIATSLELLQASLPRLIARLQVIAKSEQADCKKYDSNQRKTSAPTNPYKTDRGAEVAYKVIKRSTHKKYACYEVLWKIGGDSKSFLTHEWQSLVDIYYPGLVEQFHRDEIRASQAAAHSTRQMMFVGSRINRNHKKGGGNAHSGGHAGEAKRSHTNANTNRRRPFQKGSKTVATRGGGKRDRTFAASSMTASGGHTIQGAQSRSTKTRITYTAKTGGDDVHALLKFVHQRDERRKPLREICANRAHAGSQEDKSSSSGCSSLSVTTIDFQGARQTKFDACIESEDVFKTPCKPSYDPYGLQSYTTCLAKPGGAPSPFSNRPLTRWNYDNDAEPLPDAYKTPDQGKRRTTHVYADSINNPAPAQFQNSPPLEIWVDDARQAQPLQHGFSPQNNAMMMTPPIVQPRW